MEFLVAGSLFLSDPSYTCSLLHALWTLPRWLMMRSLPWWWKWSEGMLRKCWYQQGSGEHGCNHILWEYAGSSGHSSPWGGGGPFFLFWEQRVVDSGGREWGRTALSWNNCVLQIDATKKVHHLDEAHQYRQRRVHYALNKVSFCVLARILTSTIQQNKVVRFVSGKWLANDPQQQHTTT